MGKMIKIFVSGHGRCNESKQVVLPRGFTVYWYGELGNPVTKAFSSAVLSGTHKEIVDSSLPGEQAAEHYLCDTLALENKERAIAFQKGRWDTNTYLIAINPGHYVSLTNLCKYAKLTWPDEVIVLHWSICRSSVKSPGTGTYHYEKKVVFQESNIKPTDAVPKDVPLTEQNLGDFQTRITVYQWTGNVRDVPTGTGVTSNQAKKVGARKTGGGSYEI